MTEKQWMALVVELAGYYGWELMHILDARGSTPGWPDLVLWRPPEVLLRELKTDRGRLTGAQSHVLGSLGACGLDVGVWRPRDLEAVHARLKRR